MTPAPGRGARGGRPGPGDRGRPALAVGVGVVVAALLVSGWSSAGPAGAGEPVAGDRYIDEVFTEVTETSDVVYGEAVNVQGETEQLEMDIFEPTGDAAAARPVLMFLHGGGFTSGDKSSPLIRRLAQSFARRGYVTASVNYRLTDDEEFVVAAIIDAARDLRMAGRWFRANAEPDQSAVDFPLGRDLRIDPTRISGGGYSAGAVTALTVGYQGNGDSPGANPGRSGLLDAVVSISGAAIPGAQDGTDAPALFFHGDEDTRVWYDDGPFGFSGVETCERARAVSLDCIFRTYAGVAHGVPMPEREAEILAMTAHFLSCRPGARPVFPDAVGRWFEQGAGFVDRHGIMEGFPDGTFRGDEGMSRAQAVRMLYRFSGSPVDGARPDHGLSDVPPWIEEAVRWAVAEGIMTGFPDGTFRPDEGLTRAQFTRAMHRVAGSTPTAGLAPHGFTDVPAWVEGEVRWVGLPRESQALAGSSIMTGFPDGTFGPNAFVTRAQAARALSRLAHPASAWSVTFQGTPLDIACYRVGDPPA